MADYDVLVAVGQTLIQLLWQQIQFDPELAAIIASEQQISLEPPAKFLKDTEVQQDTLSLYLYQIEENGEMKNQPPRLVAGKSLKMAPLSLNLFYLVTPLTGSAVKDQKLLGKIMQIFYDQAILAGPVLQGSLKDSDTELQLLLNPMSLEDLTKLWNSWQRPYRLSVSYEVKVVFIASQRFRSVTPVHLKQLGLQHLKEG